MITTRESIAIALSAVPGINGYDRKPTVVRVGDAWPLVDQLTRGPGASFQTTWRIALVLGSDVATATDKLDELVPEATQALQAEAYVDLARPVEIPTEAGPMYGVEIIARSE